MPSTVKRAAVLLVLLFLAPLAAADPPPGQPDVVNDICSTWNSADGVCDDYDSALDHTPSDEWMRSSVEIDIEDAEMVEMKVGLAVHEMSRDDLRMDDLDLEGDSKPWDGIPADYIRNYQSLSRGGGDTVSDLMLERVEEIMEEFIDINFPNVNTTTITTVSEINFKSQPDANCVYSADYDSIDEVNGFDNDPFYPPLCFEAVLQMEVDSESFGLKPETSDINRMMQGLLTMGAALNSNFTASSSPGHSIELSVFPPPYANVQSVESPGATKTRELDGHPQTYSMLEIDNADYLRTAISKGLPPTRIFLRHQLRNAILPVITVLGPSIAAITTGGFVVELVFAIPGLGRYFVQAVQQSDYTVIMGTTVFYGAFLVFMVIVVDLLYGLVDPRVRLD